MTSQLHAGVARVDITPPIGIAHANWGAQVHERAAGVDLPLWATALALRTGETTIVIVDLDIAWLWDGSAARAKKAITELTGLPEDHIRLSYTHTHSGPSSPGRFGSWVNAGAEMVEPFDAALTHKVAGVAWAAINALQPARLGSGIGHSTVAINRRFQRPEDGAVIVGRNPDGPVDHDVTVLRIDAETGEPLAAVVGYACHPITVGPDNDQITPDYPGALKRAVESATGATCLFLQGACGDIGPRRGVAQGGAREYKRIGAILGAEASRVWWEIDSQPRRDRYEGTLESGAPLAIYTDELLPQRDATIRVATRIMNLPLRELPPPDEMEAAFKENFAKLTELRETGGSEAEIKLVTMACKRTAMRAQLSRDAYGKTHRALEVQAITFGDDIALVAIPAEPFIEIGLGVKAGSPFPNTLFSGYSNVGWSYIPVEHAYPLGGYEIEVTPWAPAAAQQIVEESTALLNEMANRG